jgi:hypothetical protein
MGWLGSACSPSLSLSFTRRPAKLTTVRRRRPRRPRRPRRSCAVVASKRKPKRIFQRGSGRRARTSIDGASRARPRPRLARRRNRGIWWNGCAWPRLRGAASMLKPKMKPGAEGSADRTAAPYKKFSPRGRLSGAGFDTIDATLFSNTHLRIRPRRTAPRPSPSPRYPSLPAPPGARRRWASPRGACS